MAQKYSLALPSLSAVSLFFCILSRCLGDADPLTDYSNSGFNSEDFVFRRVVSASRATISNAGGSLFDSFVSHFPALEGQGVSMSVLELNSCGVNTPHSHPRASEFHFIEKGTLNVTFVDTTRSTTRSFTLSKGDAFVIPRSLLHYEQNVGQIEAVSVAFYNSQLPGTVAANTGASAFPVNVLATTFGQFDLPQVRTLFREKETREIVPDAKCLAFFRSNPDATIFSQ